METKTLAIAVVERDGKILMRKKPDGSPPYAETWYLFGAEILPDEDPRVKLGAYLKNLIGIDVEVEREIESSEETKLDLDGLTKRFVYLNFVCRYAGGEAVVPAGAERVEWVEKLKLAEYDCVPPSVELFQRLGYL
jgi:hypothetical protein